MTRQKLKSLFPFYPYIIAAFVLLLCLLVWPLRLLGHTSYKSASLDRGITDNLSLSDSFEASGQFVPSREFLESISFQFTKSSQAQGGSVILELYNSAQTPVASVSVDIDDIMSYRWISFPVDFRAEPGQTYTWRIRTDGCPEDGLRLYTGSAAIGPGESVSFYYNAYDAAPVSGLAPYVTYTYRDRPDFSHALPYYSIFFLCGLLLFSMCRKFETTNED